MAICNIQYTFENYANVDVEFQAPLSFIQLATEQWLKRHEAAKDKENNNTFIT